MSSTTANPQITKIKLDHVGWITQNIKKFEAFWCDILGFEQVHESFLTPEMGYKLFQAGPALIRRYSHPDWEVDIEIHQFNHHSDHGNFYYQFQRIGINHICIHTGGPGSRKEFLDSLPKGHFELHIYDNPKGWQNIFLQDYEGNWVELRENL